MVEILLVEDFEPFRRRVTALVQEHPDFRIVGAVADGLQAVQKAEELQPHIVLLDIGLPKLNGIEVARKICRSVPHSHIVFLTQESSSEIVDEAFELGAKGYILKADMLRDLLIGINTVSRGEVFISSSLEGNGFRKYLLARNRTG